MTKQVLSVEQCREITTLGVDMSDATMFIGTVNGLPSNIIVSKELVDSNAQLYVDFVPTYTLTDILDKLPGHIDTDDMSYCLLVDMDMKDITYWSFEKEDHLVCFDFVNDDCILDAAFNMYKWFLNRKEEQQ